VSRSSVVIVVLDICLAIIFLGNILPITICCSLTDVSRVLIVRILTLALKTFREIKRTQSSIAFVLLKFLNHSRFANNKTVIVH